MAVTIPYLSAASSQLTLHTRSRLVADKAGANQPVSKVVTWEVEMMSLNHLKSYGWTRNTVQPGDVITCTGGAARSGAPAMLTSLVKLNDGRMIKS